MIKNFFCLCLAVVVIVLNFSVDVTYALHVRGEDFSGHSAPTYVYLPNGEKITLQVNEERTIAVTNGKCFIKKFGLGWSKVPVKPTSHVNVKLKSKVFKPEPLFFLIALEPRRIFLNYPPANSPWHMPAGVSQLSSLLRQDGHEVVQRYSHILGLEYLLKQNGDIEEALRIIRSPKSDILNFYQARMTFEKISRSIVTPDKFAVERNNVSYVCVYGNGTIEGLLTAIERREKNLWYDYFNEVEVPLALSSKPHIYGISIADERQLIPGCIFASMIKEAMPNTLVVLGGNFWSRVNDAYDRPEMAKLFDYCDAIVYREGFQPLRIMAATLKPSEAPSIIWRRSGSLVRNPLPDVPSDFEALPTPEFDGGARQWSADDVYPLYTMSNCPTGCGFCAISAGSDTYRMRARAMSPKRIAEHMVRLGNLRHDITDETFSLKRQLSLGDELKRLGHPATWQCYMTVTSDLLNEDVCGRLYKAGCRGVQLGLESLSPETLKREHKNWNHPENYGKILANLKNAGIQTHVFLMTSLPGEPLSSSLKWLAFLEEHGDSILTIKGGRYRLARMSREEREGTHSDLIEVLPDSRPLHLNKDFHYKNVSRKRVEALRDMLEQACREHWAYGVTSSVPWWINRGRFSWSELKEMAKQLPKEAPISHLSQVITKVKGVVRDELGIEAKLDSYRDVLDLSHFI